MARLSGCLAQIDDEGADISSRISAANAARPYLEALTRDLVDQALAEGQSWEDIAALFGSSPQNVRQRFGSYRY